jgi:hypothetical protein
MYLDSEEEGDPLVVAGLGSIFLSLIVRLVHYALHMCLNKYIEFFLFNAGVVTVAEEFTGNH